MFRKPSKKKKPSKIRKRPQGDEEEDGEEDLSIQDKIRSTQKKQKILSSLPLVTGDPSKRVSKKPSTKDANNTDTGDMSVLDKKHAALMQDYIEQELNKDKPTGSNDPKADSSTNDTSAKDVGATDEETLYQEIAKEVYSQRQHLNQQVQEERGAVLVAGTGLAEVILPASRVSDNSNNRSQQNKNRVYRKDGASSAVPASSSMGNAALSAAPQFRSFQQHRKPIVPQDESKETNKDMDAENAADGDGDRVGFNAYRGKPTERKPIVKKQRDDLVFSGFVKHQREKMMNRR